MAKKTKKRGWNGGRRPPESRIAEMRGLGYGMASEVAAKHEVSASSVYGWAKRWVDDGHAVMVAGKKRAAALRGGDTVWVLFEAVRQRVVPPGAQS